MRKTLCKVALVGAMVLGVLYAQDDATKGKEAVSRNGITFYVEPNSVLKQDILSGKMDNAIEKIKQEDAPKAKAARASAPPVSAVYIIQVDSESISANQQETQQTHSGTVTVRTRVVGYGGSQYDRATFSGVAVKQVSSNCWDSNNDRICDGWIDTWSFSKTSSVRGQFVFEASSVNAGPTKQTWIMIK